MDPQKRVHVVIDRGCDGAGRACNVLLGRLLRRGGTVTFADISIRERHEVYLKDRQGKSEVWKCWSGAGFAGGERQ